MEIICMGQEYDKKAPKINVCLKDAGFQNMLLDLSLFCPANVLEHREEAYEKYIKDPSGGKVFLPNEPERMEEVVCKYHLQGMKKNGWIINIAKAPMLPRDTKRRDLDSLMYQLAVESMKIGKMVGAAYLIIEPLPDRSKNKEFFLSLAPKAKELGIRILIKNCYDSYNGHFVRNAFADSYQLTEFVDSLNQTCKAELFGICMDTGVCNVLGQNMYEFATILGDKIKAVVLRENDGIHDSALLPFACADKGQDKVDWLGLIRGLRKISFDGELIIDFRDTIAAHSHMLWERLTELAFETASYFEWQLSIENRIRKYKKRVLFGAGNMCRAYMKCYGEEFPPLFTCDNNEKLWGHTFEGLVIKNPEELRRLPVDCAIFICNIYYDEIDSQLRDMGIRNPIERFNDEFMPSFYFDRMDAETKEIK